MYKNYYKRVIANQCLTFDVLHTQSQTGDSGLVSLVVIERESTQCKTAKRPPTGSIIGTNVQQGTGASGGKMMQKWGRGQGFGRLTNYSQYDVWNFKGEVDV